MATGVSKTKWRGQHRVLSAAPLQSNGSPFHVIYEGKADERAILATAPARLVQLWPQAAPYGVASGNRLIYGDNLPVQIALLDDPQIRGKVQVAYIDPPFATGGVFQSRSQSDAYTDLLFGADYIEFLRARIILLRELLAPTGSIYVHLDSNMAFCIKLIMDEVFGRRNFRNWITRRKCNPKNYTRKAYGNVCDFILFYTKTDDYVWHRPVESWTDERALREYQYVDEKTGRRYKKVPVHAPGVRHGATGSLWKGKLPPPGKHWQYTPLKLDAMDARGEIYWSPTGNPRRKIFLDDSAGVPVQDLWLDYRDAHNQNIRITGYPTEKNAGLLERIVSASSNPGDLVLDCFSGSGTTLAVASELGRRWIGIDNSPEGIAVTLRRFAKGLEPMGDFVNGKNGDAQADKAAADTLPLFRSLETPLAAADGKAHKTVHKPITDFRLCADQSVANDLSAILDQWRIDIGDTTLLTIAKESRGKHFGRSNRGRVFTQHSRDKAIKAYPLIAEVEAQPNQRLLVRFRNGVTKLYDCKRILKHPAFEPLRNDEALFRRAHADEHGYGVIWNDNLDLAESEVWIGGHVVREKPLAYGNSRGKKMARASGTPKQKRRDQATADRKAS